MQIFQSSRRQWLGGLLAVLGVGPRPDSRAEPLPAVGPRGSLKLATDMIYTYDDDGRLLYSFEAVQYNHTSANGAMP